MSRFKRRSVIVRTLHLLNGQRFLAPNNSAEQLILTITRSLGETFGAAPARNMLWRQASGIGFNGMEILSFSSAQS